ncbi:MAG: peptidase papain [Nocardioides sp.]|uniref:hypothetical protein n=1 Tax=Nocardioides sp. TaxID=35761 RepID=UPI0026180647|nr:hypothetical protein [Nocardioides sp.]MCW2834192.1 peptidase papain [Nocardioides sp.]
MNPTRADAGRDKDHDGLRNLTEYRLDLDPVDEDSDNDGADDGDEVKDGSRSTDPHVRDTDNDGTRDGDEDADGDGFDNEDEDDSLETCLTDDDDRDEDGVDDEDENEQHSGARDSDSDDDGIEDGDEDGDHDGEQNEDEDDSVEDNCEAEHGEDDSDLMGTIISFDAGTGALVINTLASEAHLSLVVTEETEIEFDTSGSGSNDEDGSAADLVPGAEVAEIGMDDGATLEEIELVRAS